MLHPEQRQLRFDHSGKADVVLFNSVVHRRKELVKLTVDSDRVDVYGSSGNLIPSQINPVWKTFSVMYDGIFELMFYADLPEFKLSYL